MCQEVKATRLKLGKLIEYNMRNIFLKKLYTKCGGEVSSRPFYKKISTIWNAIYFVFNVCSSRGLSIILKLRCWPLTFILHKSCFFLKKKKQTSGTSLPVNIFEEIYFAHYILLTDQISLPDCLYFLGYWTICVL